MNALYETRAETLLGDKFLCHFAILTLGENPFRPLRHVSQNAI